MNYHLMIDDKFVDDFIIENEEINSGKNVYYVLSKYDSPRYVKSSIATFTKDIEITLLTLSRVLSQTDQICIHWLYDDLSNFILNIDRKIRVSIFFWGGDILSDPPEVYSSFNYEPMTLKIWLETQKKNLRKFRITRNPLNVVKNQLILRSHLKNIRFRLSQKHAILKRADFLFHWNPNDYKWLTNYFSGLTLSYVYFFYGVGFKEIPQSSQRTVSPIFRIWLGNSASMTNNHIDSLNALAKLGNENIEIHCPLSYGDETDGEYTKKVIDFGKKTFGEKFQPILNFMERNEYYKLLGNVDLAIMPHNRSQAAGNIAIFIQLGTPVVLQEKSTIYKLLIEKGIQVLSHDQIMVSRIEDLNVLIDSGYQTRNQNLLEMHIFNEEKKKENLRIYLG